MGTTSAEHIFNSGIINMYVENLHIYVHERRVSPIIFSRLLASSLTRNAYVHASIYIYIFFFFI